MSCRHLHQLFDVCREHSIKLSSTDLIRIVCRECGISEECPSMLCDEYDGRHPDESPAAAKNLSSLDTKSAKDQAPAGNKM